MLPSLQIKKHFFISIFFFYIAPKILVLMALQRAWWSLWQARPCSWNAVHWNLKSSKQIHSSKLFPSPLCHDLDSRDHSQILG